MIRSSSCCPVMQPVGSLRGGRGQADDAASQAPSQINPEAPWSSTPPLSGKIMPELREKYVRNASLAMKRDRQCRCRLIRHQTGLAHVARGVVPVCSAHDEKNVRRPSDAPPAAARIWTRWLHGRELWDTARVVASARERAGAVRRHRGVKVFTAGAPGRFPAP